MIWHARDSIALVELIFYIPFALVSAFVCYHHGFSRSSGWIYTLILCIVRIIGGICQFVSHSSQSAGLLQTILLLDSVGLSPLLLATLGLISRFVDFINAALTPKFTVRHFRILQLVLLVGMILAIVGGSNVSVDANGTYQIPSASKIGVILYTVGFVGITLVFVLSVPQTSAVPSKERRVPIAITLALPFILVRLTYSMLSVFVHDHLFSVATGSVPVRTGMAVIEEFIVVAVYVILGLLVDKLDASTRGPIASRPWNARKRKMSQQATTNTVVDLEAQHLNSYPTAVSSPHPQSNGVAR
ncbi:hypothetical protein BU25DRAFT_349861 [Macroventuria anomochaeta]|uniref:Uncharacterized protein n=1 Tax=Macroventuria anomochaeta TaxID=301207 RepID=A0ACB6RP31_9PLEO|nr:uncharacterized protein BU25DRAFT_349861 [Macroventuria anomochaeta]KAF2623477.1 hypothetical protein BU25DRAFT_349861 [Macroventuria anomochaeta]